MLNADAIKEITRLSQSVVTEIDGHKFLQTTSKLEQVPYPKLEEIECFSLTQVLSLIVSFVRRTDEKLIVNVPDYNNVNAFLEKPNAGRAYEYLCSSMFKPHNPELSNPKSQEDFFIAVMSVFTGTTERDALLKLTNSVKAERVNTSSDNGISQEASMKAGVHLSSTAEVKNFWQLNRMVTFPEITQPTIPYFLRLHQRDAEMPRFALYECDGGAWKVNTTVAVREYVVSNLKVRLEEKFENVTVL